LAKYKHIIWDWNGTLIDDAWLCVDIINSLLGKYGKPRLTLETYHKVFDFPVKDYYQRIGFDFSVMPFEKVGTEFMEIYWQRWKECRLQPGALKVLQTNAQRGMTQSILSAADIKLLRACIDHFDLSEYFVDLIGLDHHYASSKVGLAKKYMRALSFSPDKVLFIGDTLHDFEVAREIQVDCVLFSGGHHPKYKLAKCGVPVIDSFAQLRI